MKIKKVTKDIIRVDCNKESYDIDISGNSYSLYRFLNFFRQLASELKMGINDYEFINLIEEEDIFEVYYAAGTSLEIKRTCNNFFEAAESLYDGGITENLVKGQKVRGILESDYDFLMTLKGKVSPRWLRQHSIKMKSKETIEKQWFKGKALGPKDYPILPLSEETTNEHTLH